MSTVTARQDLQVHIRWLLNGDMAEVMAIEEESHEFPWSERDLVICNRQLRCITLVAEHDDRVIGFIVYDSDGREYRILNLATAFDYRLNGVAAQLVAKLVYKLTPRRRPDIIVEVREANVPAQLFFRRQGFRVVAILRDYYFDTPEDAYSMRYRIGQKER